MLTQILFYLLAGVAVLCAGMMVSRQSPVASALWLIGTFFSVAAIYTLLGAFFIGIVQIMVYAGAIMVLFLFVIMLLNLGNDYEDDIRGTAWKIMAGGAALVMIAFLGRVFGGELPRPLGTQLLATSTAERGVVGVIGIPLYTDYMVPLQATAILLLVSVVGAVVLAKRKV